MLPEMSMGQTLFQPGSAPLWDLESDGYTPGLALIATRRTGGPLLRPDIADQLLRYEATFERAIDRSLAQLERLQRMRRGQPVPPPLKVELSQ